jgi:hypothetical protein
MKKTQLESIYEHCSTLGDKQFVDFMADLSNDHESILEKYLDTYKQEAKKLTFLLDYFKEEEIRQNELEIENNPPLTEEQQQVLKTMFPDWNIKKFMARFKRYIESWTWEELLKIVEVEFKPIMKQLIPVKESEAA